MTRIKFPTLEAARKRLLGKTLIDIEYNTDPNYFVFREDSMDVVLHFNDGSELGIYGNGKGVIYIEED